ncbi:protein DETOXIFICATION 55-like [Pyrus x bretschneideri]|uniref:protein DETOXIFICATION 55-like n=1 Tax=Pyrus x bretschneideri TaxID=225117 RepID=UPI00202F41F7|nr:protein DETOXIFICATION 55-like [Pyrus x bretschneideri]
MVEAAEQSQKYPTMAEVVEELQRMTHIGFPIAAMSLVGYLKNMVLVVCMGRLGSLELAGGALAIGFTNITGYSVLSGLAMGMEPLCSQAFGSQNFSIAFHTLQRTILLLLLTSLLIALLWSNLEPLLFLLHQNQDITRIASLYCQFAIPDLVTNSLLHPIRIFLRSQSTTWPLMWSTLLAIILHIPLTIFLTFTLSLGIKGIAISTSLTNFITLFFLVGYMVYAHITKKPFYCLVADQCEPTTKYDTSQTLYQPLLPKKVVPLSLRKVLGDDEWRMLIRLALQSCLGVCLEWWWYEFMTILAGYLRKPHIALATSAIVIQTTSLMYTLPTTLSASVSTRVGNELGAGQPKKARLAAVVAVGMALMSSLLGLLLTTLGREAWGRIFTDDNEVLELTMGVLPIVGLCEIANCPQTTSCGILRGSARPGIGAWINFYSFYMVGAPVAIVLTFVWRLGFKGLCYGLLAAQVTCVVSILTVVHKTDWEKEWLKTKEFVGKNNHGMAAFAHADETVKCEEGVAN